MSLSENIRKLRLEKGMTQEQLAEKLGISAQAISKWETTETYPDGALLLPLANELNVSLDALFGNKNTYMADISTKIYSLFADSDQENHFSIVRDICWQIEKGLFFYRSETPKYSDNELLHQNRSSYILRDHGFTHVSNGKEPYFMVFPEPENGFGHFLENKDNLLKIFTALSSPKTMDALIYLYKQPENFIFEPLFLANECGISEDEIDKVISDLEALVSIYSSKTPVNGETRTICRSKPDHKIIALLITAQELYRSGYVLQAHQRNKPFIAEDK